MADIAMLVAEEYERRLKSSSWKKAGEEVIDQSLVSLSCVGILGQNLIRGFSTSVWIKEKVIKVVMVLEPKSQMSVAATNGFFSA